MIYIISIIVIYFDKLFQRFVGQNQEKQKNRGLNLKLLEYDNNNVNFAITFGKREIKEKKKKEENESMISEE
jgi:hypothetical protein